MTLAAKRQTVGLEFSYNKQGFPANPVPYKLKPNQAFTKGQLVLINNTGQADGGLVVPATHANIANSKVVGVMAEAISTVDNPANKIRTGLVYDNPYNVYTVTVVDHSDQSVADNSNTTTRTYLTSITEDDNGRGTLVYYYEGPGAPAIRTIKAIDDANWFDIEEPLVSIPTTATKLVIFGASTLAAAGVNQGSTGVKVNSTGTRAVVNAVGDATNGVFNIVDVDPANLMVDVIIMASKHYLLS